MKIKLNRIELYFFKGVPHFVTNFAADLSIIEGKNASGKTTVMDAWLWLLFDRDSRGYKGAEAAKPMSGADFIHHLETSVTAYITVDDTPVSLRKVLREKWVKSAGALEESFSGNTTDYWIDEVPHTFTQYKEALAKKILDPDTFQLLSDPTYFSEIMPWRDRLNLIVAMAGGTPPDADIIGTDTDMADMIKDKAARPMDDYRKVLRDKLALFNKQLTETPVRIAELNRQIVKDDWASIEGAIANLNAEMDSLDKDATDAAEAIKPRMELEAKKNYLVNERTAVITKIFNAKNQEADLKKAELAKMQASLDRMLFSIKTQQNLIDDRARRKDFLEKETDNLREQAAAKLARITELKKSTFETPESALYCPTCGQALPGDNAADNVEKLRQEWEYSRGKMINQLQDVFDNLKTLGIKNNLERDELQTAIESAGNILKSTQTEYDKVFNAVAALQLEIDTMPAYTKEQAAMQQEVQEIDNLIEDVTSQLAQPFHDRKEEIMGKRGEIRRRIEELTSKLAQRTANEKAEARIAELKQEMASANVNKSILEKHLWKTDEYIRLRTQIMESEINNLFMGVTFRLFKEQINGGLEETCEAIVDTTVFGKANSAGMINAGLGIIDAIGEYKDIRVPVFVDHFESITDHKIINTQMILLKADDCQLTVREFN